MPMRWATPKSAAEHHQCWLPVINDEDLRGGLVICQVPMQEGGVIRSDAVRHPLPQVDAAAREGRLDITRRLEPLVPGWGG
jgi:2-keto-3-deoxy-L-arabinonate dehydratase